MRNPNMLLSRNSVSHNDVNHMLASTQPEDLNPTGRFWARVLNSLAPTLKHQLRKYFILYFPSSTVE